MTENAITARDVLISQHAVERFAWRMFCLSKGRVFSYEQSHSRIVALIDKCEFLPGWTKHLQRRQSDPIRVYGAWLHIRKGQAPVEMLLIIKPYTNLGQILVTLYPKPPDIEQSLRQGND